MITDAERLAELVADIAEQPSWTFTLLGESTQAVTITISVRDRDCLVAALRSFLEGDNAVLDRVADEMIAGLRRELDKPFSGLALDPIEAVELFRRRLKSRSSGQPSPVSSPETDVSGLADRLERAVCGTAIEGEVNYILRDDERNLIVKCLRSSPESDKAAGVNKDHELLLADFREWATHKSDCAGGDGVRCECGFLDAWSAWTSKSSGQSSPVTDALLAVQWWNAIYDALPDALAQQVAEALKDTP